MNVIDATIFNVLDEFLIISVIISLRERHIRKDNTINIERRITIMEKCFFTREHYVQTWETILSSYQWWGHDLIPLLENIKQTHPVVSNAFGKMYEKTNVGYVAQTFDSITKFYQKLSSLIPKSEKLYTRLEVKALRKKNDNIAINESYVLNRVDYLIAILCFMEEFALLSLNEKNVASTKNMLAAHAENVDVFVERNTKKEITIVRITIPCELIIEYSCSEKLMK